MGRYLDPDNTWFVFKSRTPTLASPKAKAMMSTNTNEIGEDGLPIQYGFVKLPPHAKIGGTVYAISGGATSNKLTQTEWPCSILPSAVDFSTSSERDCQQ